MFLRLNNAYRRNVVPLSWHNSRNVHFRNDPTQHIRPLPSSQIIENEPSPADCVQAEAASQPPLFVNARIPTRSSPIPPSVSSQNGQPDDAASEITNKQRRLDLARANTCFHSFCRRIRFNLYEEAKKYIYYTLSQPDFPSQFRGRFFENVIETYLDRRRYNDAIEVYEKMREEGINESSPLKAIMLTLGHVRSNISAEQLEEGLVKILNEAKENFSEMHFKALFTYLSDLGHDRSMLERLTYVFIENHGTGYRLSPDLLAVVIAQHIGSLREAEAWLDYHSESLRLRPNVRNPKDAKPYAAFVNIIASRNKVRVNQCKSVFERMSNDKVWPDLTMINTVIKLEARNGRYETSFALYENVLKKRQYGLHPSEFTYATLFSSIYGFWSQSLRRRLQGDFPSPPWLIPPRVLFREMLETYDYTIGIPRIAGFDAVITQSVLNLPLRVFMHAYDYTAALVALRCFRLLGIDLSANTGATIVSRLIVDIYRSLMALQPGSPTGWIHYFLPANLDPLEIQREKEDVIAKILFHVGRKKMSAQGLSPDQEPNGEKEEEIKIFGGTKEEHRSRASRLKTVNTLMCDNDGQGFKFEFLDALLQRCVEASAGIPDEGPYPRHMETEDWEMVNERRDEAMKEMEESLSKATKEMIPDMPKAVKRLQEREKRFEEKYGMKTRFKSFQLPRSKMR